VFGLVLALAAAGAAAQEPDTSQVQVGDFGAKLLVTDDLQGFWTAWDRPENPEVTTTSRITRAKPIFAIVIFHDCKPAADGNCDLSLKFEMRGPDGRPYGEPHDSSPWKGPRPPNHNIQALPSTMGFILEQQDKLGGYSIMATLTDNVAGKSVRVSDVVTAVDDASAARPTT
jgi:hypothetical protein